LKSLILIDVLFLRVVDVVGWNGTEAELKLEERADEIVGPRSRKLHAGEFESNGSTS
jgi:hypothetical protein